MNNVLRKLLKVFIGLIIVLLISAFICILIVTTNIVLYTNSFINSSLIQNIFFFGLTMFIAILLAYRYSVAYLKMEDMSEKLINIDKLKDEFLAKTSHEIKTPLHGIINISEALLEEKSFNLLIIYLLIF